MYVHETVLGWCSSDDRYGDIKNGYRYFSCCRAIVFCILAVFAAMMWMDIVLLRVSLSTGCKSVRVAAEWLEWGVALALEVKSSRTVGNPASLV